MRVRVAIIEGIPEALIPKGERSTCVGAVFRDDYARCTNKAIKVRGSFKLCASHNRKGELEIIVDTDT